MTKKAIEAFYNSLQVNEKRTYCPRIGIYLILETYSGRCYDKDALMAKCNWRATEADIYQASFVVEIQMESFKNRATTEQLAIINSRELIGREIEVNISEESPITHKLRIKWRAIPEPKTIDMLNTKLKRRELNDFEFDEINEDEIEEDHEPLD
ncbi:hypothetical protein ACS5PU_20590 [Pedobacter sp. GSP4]|uniref:hypothetical protein n=1 Tax=Pedobacter sp. GSP4 TaxID=3453716 RepID=UPI003EEF5359